MPEALWLCAALLAAIAGMASFALSLEAHWVQVFGTGEPPYRALRSAGWSGVTASLAACLMADHVTMAALVWPMTLAVAAALVAFTLSRWPQRPASKR